MRKGEKKFLSCVSKLLQVKSKELSKLVVHEEQVGSNTTINVKEKVSY